MPTCSLCRTEYPEGVRNCPRDGTALLAAGDAPRDGAGQGVRDEVLSPVSPASVGAAPSSREMPAALREPVVERRAERRAATGASSPATATLADPEAGPPSTSVVATAAPGQAFDSMLGATLAGRYRIVRRIGEGGMGAVYEAVHTIIGKRVAVKVLLEKFLAKTDFVARLLQEARLASAIGNEHIVDVTDFGTTDDGRAFVAMEFLDGESLAQLIIREAPLPVERSLRIVRQVASALGAAHAKGIVHRDIKPENVYLIRRGEDDFVKVVDFGISKAVKQGQGLGDDVSDNYRLTHTGLLLGTPLYMSPEQARGEESLDHRVDIWALGVMLYECLTGEVPFRANNYLGIISQVLTHTAQTPSQLRPELGIPDAVVSVVMRAMEKDRNRRYAEMADVEHDLERLLAGDQNVGSSVSAASAIRTPPPMNTPGRGQIWFWAAAGAALLTGVALVLMRPGDPPSTAPIGREGASAPAPAAAPTSVSAAPGPARPPALVPVTAPAPSATAPAGPLDREASDNRIAPPRVKHANDRGVRRPGSRSPEPPLRGVGAGKPFPGRQTPSPGSEAALRGALPSRSGEGYPEN